MRRRGVRLCPVAGCTLEAFTASLEEDEDPINEALNAYILSLIDRVTELEAELAEIRKSEGDENR